MPFPVLSRFLSSGDLLVFFDLEGTQFSHKVIAIGFIAYPKKEGEILFDDSKKITYHTYVKTDDIIGERVEHLTSITPALLKEKGQDFHSAILEITNLLRPYKKKYISYGNMDMRMLAKSVNENDITEMNFLRNVSKNYLDFHQYLSSRIVDNKGQSLSIERMMNLYNIENKGHYHDPLSDAIDLSLIYKEFVSDEEKAIQFFLHNYTNNPNTSSINKEVTNLLFTKDNVTKDDLIRIIRRYL